MQTNNEDFHEVAAHTQPIQAEEKHVNLLLKLLRYFWIPIGWIVEAVVILSTGTQRD